MCSAKQIMHFVMARWWWRQFKCKKIILYFAHDLTNADLVIIQYLPQRVKIQHQFHQKIHVSLQLLHCNNYWITSSHSASLLFAWSQPLTSAHRHPGRSTATDRGVDVTEALLSPTGECVPPAVGEMKQKWWSVCFLTFPLSLAASSGLSLADVKC